MRIEETRVLPESRATLWKLAGDPTGYPRFMSGVTRCEAENGGRPRVGARYRIWFQVGAAQIGNLIEIVEYVRGEELAWVGVTGIDHHGRLRLREVEDGTEVKFRLNYSVPGGVVGLIAGAVAAPMVAAHMGRTLDSLS